MTIKIRFVIHVKQDAIT